MGELKTDLTAEVGKIATGQTQLLAATAAADRRASEAQAAAAAAAVQAAAAQAAAAAAQTELSTLVREAVAGLANIARQQQVRRAGGGRRERAWLPCAPASRHVCACPCCTPRLGMRVPGHHLCGTQMQAM